MRCLHVLFNAKQHGKSTIFGVGLLAQCIHCYADAKDMEISSLNTTSSV